MQPTAFTLKRKENSCSKRYLLQHASTKRQAAGDYLTHAATYARSDLQYLTSQMTYCNNSKALEMCHKSLWKGDKLLIN